MQRTTHYRPHGIVSPTDLIRANRRGAPRPVAEPDPITVEMIDALADLDRAWSQWDAESTGERPAA